MINSQQEDSDRTDTRNSSKPSLDMDSEDHSSPSSAESEEVFTPKPPMWELISSEK